jgi:hypothetical protein
MSFEREPLSSFISLSEGDTRPESFQRVIGNRIFLLKGKRR